MPPRDVLSEGPFLDEQARLSMLLGLSTLDSDSGALSGAAIIRIDLSQFLKVLDSVRVLDENVAWLMDSTQRVLLQPDDATPPPRLRADSSGDADETVETSQTKRGSTVAPPGNLERAKSLELSTSTLARLRSTN